MPSITIDYTEIEGDIFIFLANRVGKTPKEYIEFVLQQHAKIQIDGYYQEKFNALTLSEKAVLFGDIE